MLRRLTSIATVLALVGCGDGLKLPTDVSLQENIDDRTTVPTEFCLGYVVDQSTLIPSCIDYLPWPLDGVSENRAKHGYEAVTASEGARGGRF